jgi:hypothetical protein
MFGDRFGQGSDEKPECHPCIWAHDQSFSDDRTDNSHMDQISCMVVLAYVFIFFSAVKTVYNVKVR